MANVILTKALYTVISLAVITSYALLLIGTMARVRAKVQGRVGQPAYQPFIDIIKSNAKRTSINHGVMFFLGPVFRLAGGLGTYLFIPIIYGSVVFSNFSFSGDLLLVMYFIFFGQLGMALGAGESGHPSAPIGVARGLAQMTAFELPFALSVIAVAAQYGTLSITEIVAAQQGGVTQWAAFHQPAGDDRRHDRVSGDERRKPVFGSHGATGDPDRTANRDAVQLPRNACRPIGRSLTAPRWCCS